VHQFESGGAVFDRAWVRMAAGAGRRFLCVYVDTGADESDENQRTLADNVRFAESVGAKVVKTEARWLRKRLRNSSVRITLRSGFGRSATKGVEEIFYLSAIHSFCATHPRWMSTS